MLIVRQASVKDAAVTSRMTDILGVGLDVFAYGEDIDSVAVFVGKHSFAWSRRGGEGRGLRCAVGQSDVVGVEWNRVAAS